MNVLQEVVDLRFKVAQYQRRSLRPLAGQLEVFDGELKMVAARTKAFRRDKGFGRHTSVSMDALFSGARHLVRMWSSVLLLFATRPEIKWMSCGLQPWRLLLTAKLHSETHRLRCWRHSLQEDLLHTPVCYLWW